MILHFLESLKCWEGRSESKGEKENGRVRGDAEGGSKMGWVNSKSLGNRISLALVTIHMFVKKQEAGKTCMPGVEEKPVCVLHTGEIVQEQSIDVKIWPMSFCQGS